MNVYLKIKVKAEVAESRAVRKEERKRLGFLRHCRVEARALSDMADPEQNIGFTQAEKDRSYMHTRRAVGLRQETRAMLLAYGFLRDRPYLSMENTTRTCPKWGLVLSYILRYGMEASGDDRALRQTFSGWLADSGLPDNLMPKVAAGDRI